MLDYRARVSRAWYINTLEILLMNEAELVKLLAAAERERSLVMKAQITEDMKARLCASIDARVRQAELALKAAADAPVQGAGAPKGR